MTAHPDLLFLSLRHVYSCWHWGPQKFPHVPNNQERLRAYRNTAFPEVGNSYHWPWIKPEIDYGN